MHGLREAKKVFYADLDINGNSHPGYLEGEDDGNKLFGPNSFVSNTMKIYVKNPNIMLDKRVSVNSAEAGLGDNDGWPDYLGRGKDGNQSDTTLADDYTENADLIYRPEEEVDVTGNGLDTTGIGYGTRLWYSVTVLNKPSDSPMQKGADSSDAKASSADPDEVATANPRLDKDNAYLTDKDGKRQLLGTVTSDASGMMLTKLDAESEEAVTYQKELSARRRKLAESGNVAHGAFVFSDYLPWVLRLDQKKNDTTMDYIMIQTYKADGTPDQLLSAKDAKAQGWIIEDATPDKETAVGNSQFVSITVVPPAVDTTNPVSAVAANAFDQEESAYESIGNGTRPAGYLASGQKFTLRIRTRVSDVPDVTEPGDPDGKYDANGNSKEIFFNRAFVNLDHLDGNYQKLTETSSSYYDKEMDEQGKDKVISWFGCQKKDSISYYNGTDLDPKDNLTEEDDRLYTEKKTEVRDGALLPADKFLDQDRKFLKLATIRELIEQATADRKYNQKTGTDDTCADANCCTEKDRYAFDTSAGFRVVSPRGYARVNTSKPEELLSSGLSDPTYRSVDDVKMYMAETSLLRGSVGAVYTISNLPLYGSKLNSYTGDLTADNTVLGENYCKVATTVESVKPGVWYLPETEGMTDTQRTEFESHYKLRMYFTRRSTTGDRRQEIPATGFDITKSKWIPLKDEGGQVIELPLSAIRGSSVQSEGYVLSMDERDDINQIMWMVSSDDPEQYPISAGFRLDVDTDYDKAGKQDAHALKNTQPKVMKGQYPRHKELYPTATPVNAEHDDVATNGGLINMKVNVANTKPKDVTHMVNFTTAYVNYGKDKYCKLSSEDDGIEVISQKTNAEIYQRSGLFLTQYKPVGELKLDGRYLKNTKFDAQGNPLAASDYYYQWSSDVSLTSESKVLAYTVTLDNIDQNRLDFWGMPEQQEDTMMDPVITVRIPPLLTLDANTLEYVPYENVKDNPSHPLNPSYTRKDYYKDSEKLYWTFRVVHRDYEKYTSNYTQETATNKDTNVVLRKDGGSYNIYKSGNENLLNFFFNGKLMPGDTIVIDFMVRTVTTDSTDPRAKGDNKVSNAYATDLVGMPSWVKWNNGENGDINDHTIKDTKDYDADNDAGDTLLTVKSDIIGFEATQKFPRNKLVKTILDQTEHLSGTRLPVPVLEGETYAYEITMENSYPFVESDETYNLRELPILYDVLPYVGDEYIVQRQTSDGFEHVKRESKWSPWMLPEEKEQFILKASSRTDSQKNGHTDLQENTLGEYIVDQDDYDIWLGPVHVTRDTATGAVTDVTPGDLSMIYTTDQHNADKDDSIKNFFMQLAISAYRPANNKNSETIVGSPDIHDTHITLEELLACRDNGVITEDEYHEIRKAVRDLAVTFKHWQERDSEGNEQLYRMYAGTNFTLTYKAETPLNLPVYRAPLADMDNTDNKSKVRQYQAVNTFAGATLSENGGESQPATTYVFNPEERGEIGDYVWLDANMNGKQDEIPYEIPSDVAGTGFTRKLPKRKIVTDNDGNISYIPDGWKAEDDPGINGVKVELMDGNGNPCNYDGEAVIEENGIYYLVEADGKTKRKDAGGNLMTSDYGPLSTVTRSDKYGNKGYYIFPNLEPGEKSYRLRFTLPERYNDYGLTTWEIGNDDEKVGMQVVEPNERFGGFGHADGTVTGGFTAGNRLTFVTKDAISVDAAADDADHVCYDVGIGLPVIYGGMVWMDENADPAAPVTEHDYDGYYDNPENPDEAHRLSDPDQEQAFIHVNADGSWEGATITAVIAGDEYEYGAGNLKLLKPAIDMHGKSMVTTSVADPDALLKGLVNGSYSFKYMYPGKKYEFYIALPDDNGKALYKLTQTVDTDPTERAGENDGNYSGWTAEFTTVIPTDPGTKEPQVVRDDTTGYILRREAQNVIDFGIISASANRISGTIWDDSTDVQTRPDGTMEPYDGVQRGGALGISDKTVNLYAYGWVPNPDPNAKVKGEWRALENADNGLLRFADTFDSDNPFTMTATPSDATPISNTQTKPNGTWQFMLTPEVTNLGRTTGNTYSYLVGYRVEIPELKDGYTLTTMHRNLDITDALYATQTEVDSDLAGNRWMYRRKSSLADGSVGNETGSTQTEIGDPFNRTDPYEPSIYLPYDRLTADWDRNDVNINGKELGNGNVWYDYNQRHSIDHIDVGLIPYAKGTVKGIVWNDAKKSLGRITWDGIRDDFRDGMQHELEPRIKDVPVLLQYSNDRGSSFLNVYWYDPVHQLVDPANPNYWISGNYLIPMNEDGENALAAMADGDVTRRENDLKTLKMKQTELAEKESKLAEALGVLQEKNAEADAIQVEIDERKARYAEEKSLQAEADSEAAKFQKRADDLDKEISAKQDELDALEAVDEADQDKDAIKRLTEEIAKLTEEQAKESSYATEKSLEANEHDENAKELEIQIDEKRNEWTAKQSEINDQNLVVKDIRNEVSDIEKQIEEARTAAATVYMSLAMVKTDADGEYAFDNLPMFDERNPLIPADGNWENFTDPTPFRYRILVDKTDRTDMDNDAAFTTFHVSGADPDWDSDVEVLKEDDFSKEGLSRLGISRENLGVSDSFAFMERNENMVNSYDGHFHVRMDRDEPNEVTKMRLAKRDAGLILIENKVIIGDYVWNDANRDGKQQSGEKAIPNAKVILYRYDPDPKDENGDEDKDAYYYTYELVDDVPMASPSKASPSIATSSDQKSDLKNTGNAWIDKDRTPGSNIGLSGSQKIRITGVQKRGIWKICRDLNGNYMQTTGADGRYEFTVAVVNRKAENPEDRLYRYRVKIIQPDEQETMIWSDLRTGGKHLDSDIVPSNAFMDLRVSAVDKMFGGPVPEGTELEIPGIYDPGNLNMSLMSGLGDVNGMVNTRSYRIGISSEFTIYKETAVQILVSAVRRLARASVSSDWMPDLRYIKDDLTVDAGMFAQDKPDEPQPNRPGGHGGHGGSGSKGITAQPTESTMPTIEPFPEETTGPEEEENPGLFAIPKTGVFPIGLGAFFVALISGAVMFATRRRKENEEEEHKDKKNEDK